MAGGDTLPRILELLNKARTAVAELADVKQANPDPMDIVIVNAALASLGECGSAPTHTPPFPPILLPCCT